MKEKSFKSLDEQIEWLCEKGLTITNYDFTRDILLRENYYFLNGYRHLFRRKDDISYYIEGTTFEELYSLFNFDRQLRTIIFKNILIFENNIKSCIAYVISKNYGYKESTYLSNKIFINDNKKNKQINDLLRKIKRQMSVNGKQHMSTKHYLENYGFIPLWVGVKVLSFGIIGELFLVLKMPDKEELVDIFNVSVDDFECYLPILANYRNLCAHEDIVYENRTQKSIGDTVYHSRLQIPKNEYEYKYGKNDLFALVIILKEVLSKDDFHLFINEVSYELDILEGKLSSIKIEKVLDRMGFPVDYKELMRMD